MSDTLNGIKKRALVNALGKDGHINGLEKEFWEGYKGGSGGGAIAVPSNFKFTNAGARDTYFAAHKDELKNLETYVFVGSAPQVWTGTSDPSSYDKSKWDAANYLVKGDKGDTGASINLSTLKDGEVPVFNASTNKLEASGVKAGDGEINMSPSTLIFGNHEMSSSVENVVFKNRHTHRIYAPVWQEIAAKSDNGYLRAYGKIEQVIRVPAGNFDVTNPVNKNVIIDQDEMFLGGTFTLSQDATNLEIELYDTIDQTIVWKQDLGDQVAGAKSVTFKVPIDVRKGYSYDIYLKSKDGSDVVAKSNTTTGFSWEINRCTWKDREIALQVDVGKSFQNVELVGNILKFTPKSPSVSPTEITLPAPTSGGVVPPKTVVGIAKSGNNFVFTHEDGSTTSLSDSVGATTAALQSVLAKVSGVESDIATLKADDVSIKSRITALEGKPVLPPKTTPTFYGIFANTIPTTLAGASPSAGKTVLISRASTPPLRALIIVPEDSAAHVTGIQQGSGIASLWETRDTTIDGKRYKVFFSPRGFSERSARFTLTFSQGNFYV